MLTISGRFVSKSFTKEGVSAVGNKYRIIQFTIKKQNHGKKIDIAFTAWGKNADLVDSLNKHEKVRIEFFPECIYSQKSNKYYTELKVKTIEKWTPRKHLAVILDGQTDLNAKEIEIKPDLQFKFDGKES